MTNNKYKRTIFSWSLYDFANQPFTTIILTFIYSAFFSKYISSSFEEGTIMWGRAVTISAIFVAILSPIMGAIADNGGYRKLFLIFWTWICIIFSYLLYYPIKGEMFYALLFFCIANIGFEMGGVFLNAYLPEIAPREKIGRISGYGWSFGYVGGLLALIICFMLFIFNDNPVNPLTGNLLDKDTGEHIRIINIFIAVWFAVFSLPTFVFVKDYKKVKKISFSIIKNSFISIKKTFKTIKKYRETFKFLVARLVYNDALITIFAFGGIYAMNVIHFDENEMFLFAIILNITAGIGAFLFGFLDDRLGGIKTIQISNIGFVFASSIAVISPLVDNINLLNSTLLSTKNVFWISGILIGIFSGPNQAASRSLMGRLTPVNKENEFYGFFAFSGKATAFIGPLLISTTVALTGSLQLGLAIVAILFIFGFLLLRNVDEQAGIIAANRISKKDT